MATLAQAPNTVPADSRNCQTTPPQRQPLRVGLFAAGRWQPRALVEALAEISGSQHARIVVLAVGDISRQNGSAQAWLWRAYSSLDSWAFGTPDTASEMVDFVTKFAPTQVKKMPGRTSDSSALYHWQNEMADLQLDVAFTLGEIDKRITAGLARNGVWHFDFGSWLRQPDGREGFREVVSGQTISTASLRAKLNDGSEKVLYQSWSRTSPFSLTRNRDRLLRRAASFPRRALKKLYQEPLATLNFGRPLTHHRPALSKTADSNMEALRGLASVGWKMACRGWQKLRFLDQWFISCKFSSDGGEVPDPENFTCLLPPKDRFWADPFPLQREGRYYIFFEELIFAEGKAHISVIEIDRHGQHAAPQRVLERPYHLSYPFLFENDGVLFMVPETGQNGSVELYRCERFPDQWRLEKVLLRANYTADATIHRHGGKWWMFVNLGTNDSDVHDELHLYYADHPEGEWYPHAANPVKSDVRSARSAGRLYECNGQLYRPAQIGAPLYGSGISINKVLSLTSESYCEEEVARIVPPATGDIHGVHTLNRAGVLTVSDGFIRRSRLGWNQHNRFDPVIWRPG